MIPPAQDSRSHTVSQPGSEWAKTLPKSLTPCAPQCLLALHLHVILSSPAPSFLATTSLFSL